MDSIPQHIVVFPDGNRRWAVKNGLLMQNGYLKGKDKFNEFLKWCKARGVKIVTVFGFSSENWKRPQDQIDFLMNLFEKYLDEGIDEFNEEGIKVKVIGQRERLSDSLKNVIEKVEKATENNDKIQLNLAVSYGGKWDILQAVQKMIKNNIPAEKMEEEINNYLSTAGMVEPDLVIRVGGEMRMSNFVLWQAAYSELYFSDKLWPEFSEKDLDEALEEYKSRQRRYGK